MIRASDSGPLRKLVKAMESAGCLLDSSNSGGKEAGLKSHLGGVRKMSLYFALS